MQQSWLRAVWLAIVFGGQFAAGWKPIVGSGASFAIHQSHPGVGALSSTHLENTVHHPAESYAEAAGEDESQESNILGYQYKVNKVGNFFNEDIAGGGFDEGSCGVNKYAFNYEGTVHYRNKLPELDQFTMCFWMRFTKHSGDHTLLTYSASKAPREVQIWVANSKNSSFISMAIHGQSLYRLNYPVKMGKWHHLCTSWNGKTGEWQAWMKSERIGRGFHNRLVNHKIPGHGILFSGGPSITGPTAEGLHFEMTLLQVYKIALTAGKAHRDHKHHHVHHFDHEGQVETTPRPPPPTPQPAQQPNVLLANGQIPNRVRLNLANPPQMGSSGIPSQVLGSIIAATPTPPTNPSQQQQSTNFVNGQFNSGSRFVSEQLAPNTNGGPQTFVQSQPLPVRTGFEFPGPDDGRSAMSFSQFSSPGSFIETINTRHLTKRESPAAVASSSKTITKRGLVMLADGAIVDDALLDGFKFEGLAQFGRPAFKNDLRQKMTAANIEDEIKEHDREPAEEEVKAVMTLCSSCDAEPFSGAIVFAWKDADVAIDDALQGRSIDGCGYF